jgi:integrase
MRATYEQTKTFTTWFFPVGEDIRQVFVDWVAFLREQKGFGPEDPLFPKSKVAPGEDLEFRADGLDRAHWANANPVRTIFREACTLAGLPYFNPHSLRSTLVQLAYELKLDAEQFKAWSQNLGHENCLTTFSSYGEIPAARQAEIIRGLVGSTDEADDQTDLEQLRKLAEKLARRGKAA